MLLAQFEQKPTNSLSFFSIFLKLFVFLSYLADAGMTNFLAATELDLRNAAGKHLKNNNNNCICSNKKTNKRVNLFFIVIFLMLSVITCTIFF